MATILFEHGRFLDFSSVPRTPPKLFTTAETSDFDEITLQPWRDEEFDLEHLLLENERGQKPYIESLKGLREVSIRVA